MQNQFSRTEIILGKDGIDCLKKSRVAVFGIGGVGGYVAEALARSGVGALDLIDNDEVSLTNINRQIIALHSTVGRPKVDVMKERILDINPECNVRIFQCFYLPETKNLFDFTEYNYVVDAVDTVTAKIQLIVQAKEAGVPIISSMGAGNKLNPASFEVADISQTSVCPLARVMRQECKKRGIKDVKVVYSKEKPVESKLTAEEKKSAEQKGNGLAPGSCAFVPSVAGLIIASEVVKDLCN
ncbi:MAG: tRNA threonylcarbamoyladenosine dehydratase [Treponema sp.]|uniref:tRNA threonylcarbamoyladenosine dehydratase n=1 Tax=Treponema sp. TaxID=166 RepID=UPI002A90F3DE|nr:tRNA threonylcarbamoyladenosine dehydratase [Treponema sp.]MDY6396446.1 tRNA threonylcarbamoyladenosine dehydratase [Treponema sp.]